MIEIIENNQGATSFNLAQGKEGANFAVSLSQ
jgi:hypothetical protein